MVSLHDATTLQRRMTIKTTSETSQDRVERRHGGLGQVARNPARVAVNLLGPDKTTDLSCAAGSAEGNERYSHRK